MKLPYTEVTFQTEVKSQTGLSSFQVSCKRALSLLQQLFSLCSDKLQHVLFKINLISIV